MMRKALSVDLRTKRGGSRHMLFDAIPPQNRGERERASENAIIKVWPGASAPAGPA